MCTPLQYSHATFSSISSSMAYHTDLTPFPCPGLTGLTGAQAAVMQFQHHMRTFESWVPEYWQQPEPESATPIPHWQAQQPEAGHSFRHWAWLSRQHCVAAELLQLNLPR